MRRNIECDACDRTWMAGFGPCAKHMKKPKQFWIKF